MERICGLLYEKMEQEQHRYREGLLQLSPEEILENAYEYAVRNDILTALNQEDALSAEHAAALCLSPHPLADVYRTYADRDDLNSAFDSLEETAINALAEKRLTDPETKTGEYTVATNISREEILYELEEEEGKYYQSFNFSRDDILKMLEDDEPEL